MKKLLTVVAGMLVIPSALATDFGEPRGLLYVKFPFGGATALERAAHVGFAVNTRAVAVDFSLTGHRYRRRAAGDATMDPFEASDLNWWLIGGLATAVLIVASTSKSNRDEDRVCLATDPPPPGC